MTRPTRFRIFFWLLDAATLVTLLSVGRTLIDPGSMFDDRPNDLPFHVIGVLAIVLPALLIFLRRVRDEYAELLWQAAAGTTLRGLIWIPFSLFFVWGFFDGLFGIERPDPMDQISSADTLGLMLMLQLTLFVLSLQWHRWRATRG